MQTVTNTSRADRRSLAATLAHKYNAPFKAVLRAVTKGVHYRAVALATGEKNEPQAFMAAINALAR